MKKVFTTLLTLFLAQFTYALEPNYSIKLVGYKPTANADYTYYGGGGYIYLSEGDDPTKHLTMIQFDPIIDITYHEPIIKKTKYLTNDSCVFYQEGTGEYTNQKYIITIKSLETRGTGKEDTIVEVKVQISCYSGWVVIEFIGYLTEIE